MEKLIDAGINVVVTAHAKMRKFEQPDEMGAYDRWEMKLSKQVAPILKEWADIVLFANYKTFVVEDDKTKSKKAQGGKRVMYTTHNPCWDAKNRYSLDDCLPFDYESIKAVIENNEAKPRKTKAKAEPKPEVKEEPKKDPEPDDEPELIKQLRILMARDMIDEERLIYAVATKGGCFFGEKLKNLNLEFVQKSLIDKWPGFVKYAKKLDLSKVVEEIPFK